MVIFAIIVVALLIWSFYSNSDEYKAKVNNNLEQAKVNFMKLIDNLTSDMNIGEVKSYIAIKPFEQTSSKLIYRLTVFEDIHVSSRGTSTFRRYSFIEINFENGHIKRVYEDYHLYKEFK